MITDVEEYFAWGCGRCERFKTTDCATRLWARGLAELRAICLRAGLTETAKWGHPCYMHARRNVAIIGAHRRDFRLSFFDAALMTDPENVLEKQGANTAHPDMLQFRDVSQPARMADTILDYLLEAKGYAERGERAPKEAPALELPPELVDALDADSTLAEAFAALTPGRQRSYVIALSSAKKPQTRVSRIEKYRDKIIAGKGALER